MNKQDNFTQLQSLWSNRQFAQSPATPDFPDTIIRKLSSLQSHQDKMNRIKMVVLILIFLSMAYLMSTSGMQSPLPYLGVAIVLVSTIVFFYHYLRSQFKVSRLNYNVSTADFLYSTLQLLHRQNSVFKTPFTLFTLSVLLGINILFLGVLHEESFMARLQVHTTFSLWVMLMSIIGGRVRRRRIKKEVQPLMDELQKTLEGLERIV